jgi:ABC-type uncharacterized transport system permease subunit
MHEPLVTISIILLTLVAMAASAVAAVRLRRPDPHDRLGKAQRLLVWVCTLGSGAVLAFQIATSGRWQPLAAHVDGLLLIVTLLGAVVLYLQWPSRLPGVSAFALPVLTLLLAWAICASAWTLQFFDIDSVWTALHLASVYLGAVFIAFAAIAGGMFLYAQRRLRTKDMTAMLAPAEGEGDKTDRRLPSLERLERVIIRMSALGFALLTLGLATGLVIVTSGPSRMGPGWWYSPKVVLAAAVWLIYAVLMNARHATAFRGNRAAWLSIVGLVLLLATFGLAISLPPILGVGMRPESDKTADPGGDVRSSMFDVRCSTHWFHIAHRPSPIAQDPLTSDSGRGALREVL